MEHNCRDRTSLILFSLVFILAATYRTILFGVQFHGDKNIGVFLEEVDLMKLEANWNWTLFAKKGFQMIYLSFRQLNPRNELRLPRYLSLILKYIGLKPI